MRLTKAKQIKCYSVPRRSLSNAIDDDPAIGYFDRSFELRTRRWYRVSRKFKLLGHEAPRCMVEKLQMCERGRAVARR